MLSEDELSKMTLSQRADYFIEDFLTHETSEKYEEEDAEPLLPSAV